MNGDGPSPVPVTCGRDAPTAPAWVALPLGRHQLAESPRWDAAGSELAWVDIATGALHTATRAGTTWSAPRTHEVPGRVTSLEAVPGAPRTWDVAASGRLLRMDLARGRELGSVTVSDLFPAVRSNDTLRDPVGRVLVGLFSEDRTSPLGGIVSVGPRLDPPRVIVVGEMVTANGLGLDRTGRVLFAVDTARNTLTRHPYDLDTGRAGPGTVLVRHRGPGRLDGLLVRPDGSVLVAVWGESSLHRYSADGTLLEVVAAPGSRPTALAADPAGGVVLTTASDTFPEATSPGNDDGPDGRLHWTGDLS